jgi:U3 small nucleolar RNA-associated protein 21
MFQFFDFHTTKLETTLILPSTAVSILLHRNSGLLAIVCDDMVVRIADIETKRIVRELGGFRGRVLDIASAFGISALVCSDLDVFVDVFTRLAVADSELP